MLVSNNTNGITIDSILYAELLFTTGWVYKEVQSLNNTTEYVVFNILQLKSVKKLTKNTPHLSFFLSF